MRNQPVDHLARKLLRDILPGHFRHFGDGELVDRSAFLMDIVQTAGPALVVAGTAAACFR